MGWRTSPTLADSASAITVSTARRELEPHVQRQPSRYQQPEDRDALAQGALWYPQTQGGSEPPPGQAGDGQDEHMRPRDRRQEDEDDSTGAVGDRRDQRLVAIQA